MRLRLYCRCAFKNCQHLEEPGCCFCRDFDRHAAYWVVYQEVRLLYIMSLQRCGVLVAIILSAGLSFQPSSVLGLHCMSVLRQELPSLLPASSSGGLSPAGAQLRA